mmetsp:Transcript_13546/g.18752  ORF Transcript_13546/g.18752 Transcript_13546/m.18752 type:complete len:276 (-) Transcript_13546:144-971(-)
MDLMPSESFGVPWTASAPTSPTKNPAQIAKELREKALLPPQKKLEEEENFVGSAQSRRASQRRRSSIGCSNSFIISRRSHKMTKSRHYIRQAYKGPGMPGGAFTLFFSTSSSTPIKKLALLFKSPFVARTRIQIPYELPIAKKQPMSKGENVEVLTQDLRDHTCNILARFLAMESQFVIPVAGRGVTASTGRSRKWSGNTVNAHPVSSSNADSNSGQRLAPLREGDEFSTRKGSDSSQLSSVHSADKLLVWQKLAERHVGKVLSKFDEALKKNIS